MFFKCGDVFCLSADKFDRTLGMRVVQIIQAYVRLVIVLLGN